MTDIELIAIDVDGTLIGDDLKIGEQTKKAIFAARQKGIAITLATGRMLSAASQYIDELKLKLPAVVLNGALVRSVDGEEIYHRRISHETFAKIMPHIENSSAASLVVLGDRSFGWNVTEELARIFSAWIVNIEFVEPKQAPQCPTLILISGAEQDVLPAFEKIREYGKDEFESFMFHSIRYNPLWYLEIRPAATNKGKALEKLCAHIDVSPQKTLVIGDFLNDMGMFEFAGFGAAPANAHDSIKTLSQYVSPKSCAEDAVADILEHFVL